MRNTLSCVWKYEWIPVKPYACDIRSRMLGSQSRLTEPSELGFWRIGLKRGVHKAKHIHVKKHKAMPTYLNITTTILFCFTTSHHFVGASILSIHPPLRGNYHRQVSFCCTNKKGWSALFSRPISSTWDMFSVPLSCAPRWKTVVSVPRRYCHNLRTYRCHKSGTLIIWWCALSPSVPSNSQLFVSSFMS